MDETEIPPKILQPGQSDDLTTMTPKDISPPDIPMVTPETVQLNQSTDHPQSSTNKQLAPSASSTSSGSSSNNLKVSKQPPNKRSLVTSPDNQNPSTMIPANSENLRPTKTSSGQPVKVPSYASAEKAQDSPSTISKTASGNNEDNNDGVVHDDEKQSDDGGGGK